MNATVERLKQEWETTQQEKAAKEAQRIDAARQAARDEITHAWTARVEAWKQTLGLVDGVIDDFRVTHDGTAVRFTVDGIEFALVRGTDVFKWQVGVLYNGRLIYQPASHETIRAYAQQNTLAFKDIDTRRT